MAGPLKLIARTVGLVGLALLSILLGATLVSSAFVCSDLGGRDVRRAKRLWPLRWAHNRNVWVRGRLCCWLAIPGHLPCDPHHFGPRNETEDTRCVNRNLTAGC